MTKKTKKGSNGSMPGNTKASGEKEPRVPASIHWCFTYNNYTQKNIEELIETFRDGSIHYLFQEETGENGTPHLQGFVKFPSKSRPMEKIKDKNIHWEKCKNVNASIKYCCKEDTRTGEIYSSIPFPKPIKVLSEDQLYDWQKDIVEMVKKPADDRSIYWYWETKGGIGKTQFCKYLCVKYNAVVLSGKSSDAKYGIVKYEELNGLYPDIIIFDIPRTMNDFISYEALESIKNGLFFCGKYESAQVVMNPPHILCFSNEEPDVEKMSADRWHILHLS